MDIAKEGIGNALTSKDRNHVIAVANDIYDETLEKYQSEINAEVRQGDGVYDISAANPTSGNPTPYGDLQAALTAFTDTTKKKGGMTIKFIDSNSGEFVQYRYVGTSIADVDFLNKNNWKLDGIPVKNANVGDFAVGDELGNLVVRVNGGDIETKNFNSAKSRQNTGESSFPVFDNEATYKTGDVVRYNGLLYKFISNKEAGDWDSEKVEQTSILEQIPTSDNDDRIKVKDTGVGDVDISDEKGNVVARFGGGHVKTKYFDSANIGMSTIKTYWKEYLDEKIPELKAEELALGRNGAAFIFFTDVHWGDNYNQSPAIIDYILNNTGIKDVICGGDIVTSHDTKDKALNEQLRDFADRVSHIPCINLIGNHDYNTSDQTINWEYRISPEEHYRAVIASSERKVEYTQIQDDDVTVSSAYNYPNQSYGYNNGRYPEYFGYCDNKSQKLRYIFLDSTCVHIAPYGMFGSDLRISDNQLIWMQDRIKELDNTWTVVVFTHICLGKGYTQDDNTALLQIGSQIDAALVDESVDNENNACIAAVVCGHNHRDTHAISSNGKFYFISTRSDARKNAQVPPEYKDGQYNYPGINNTPSSGGDTTEQAIDVYFINTENKTITIKRIGAGDSEDVGSLDRTFTYSPITQNEDTNED